ncbi:MAG: M20 family metallopeptidase [Deltaproteobacteria bacterium]|nr:M20 family metallopeptidase [Deltaproteobacteria bacterium]MBW1927742.1 M20 family metallopeptidase [Deltaproteobacteria bacterium]MBW2026897.1 M20 family metallopeptidase [Deltaproteobacteria bacterium]RLB20256.1 MAG: M20 family peptidase [Deltaproteobacteria bacterium]
MTSDRDTVHITRSLVSLNTTNPPGNEAQAASFLSNILEKHGFVHKRAAFAEHRASLVAYLGPMTEKPAICFCGHMDTVPLGQAPWQHDPFAGEVDGDRIYGRGASDMKSGLAAMILMAQRLAKEPSLKAGLCLVFTAGEETFCQGARHLAGVTGALPKAGAMVVCEPTSNRPLVGHRGAIHLEVQTKGISAHASMPELGENAIYKAAEAALKLRELDFGLPAHPLLGKPTLNVGTISGGVNINSIPDQATMGVDIRIIPGQDPQTVLASLRSLLGEQTEVRLLDHAPSVATDPQNPWVQEVFEIVETITGHSQGPAAAPYFTDASVLTPALGNPPTLILGPGEAEMAHKTDEYCYISKIEEAVEIYTEIARRWCCS